MGLSTSYITSSDVRRLDLNSEYLGVSSLQLMENAGRAVASEVSSRFKKGSKIIILAGTGRNGGDGMVAARHLASMGYHVKMYLVGYESLIQDKIVSFNWNALKKMSSSVSIDVISDSSGFKPFKADVIVDSLLGIGFVGPLRQPVLEAVRTLNRSEGFVVSIDVPTGIDCDNGEVGDEAVRAKLTVTFQSPKSGFSKVKEFIGEVVVAEIGIPPEADLYAGPGDVEVILKRRLPDSKKGDFGRLLIIGGSETYTGAPAFVALAALRAGVDLAYIAAPIRTAETVASLSPNLITYKLSGEHFNSANMTQLNPLLEKATAIVVGPGIGLHKESFNAISILLDRLESLHKPTLIDADALKAFEPLQRKMSFPVVLTPHAGEFEILSGRDIPTELEKKIEEVKSRSKKSGAVILLKGKIDIISDGLRVKLNRTGNPGMTVGGTGDVLSGIVASLMAQGCRPFEAAVAGAFINGAAGDFAYKEKGFHIMATDLLDHIPYTMINPMRHRDVQLLEN